MDAHWTTHESVVLSSHGVVRAIHGPKKKKVIYQYKRHSLLNRKNNIIDLVYRFQNINILIYQKKISYCKMPFFLSNLTALIPKESLQSKCTTYIIYLI